LTSALDGGEWSASRLDRALPPVPIVQEAECASEPVRAQRLQEKLFCPRRGSNPDRSVVQSIVRLTELPRLLRAVFVNIIL
jgi:hypothetical protein